MEPQDWIQIGLMVTLVVVTAFYAWRTHKISRATTEQAEATIALASREYIKEFIRLEIHPLLKRCKYVQKMLNRNYFGQDFGTGWPEIYGAPSEFSEEEAQILCIGTHQESKVFSYPDPSLGILEGRYYSPPDMSVLLRLRELEEEHKEIANRIASFDSQIPQLNKLLRKVAAEVKKHVAPYVSKMVTQSPVGSNSDLDKGRFFSHVTDICFNYLLLTPEDFETFFKQFQREQAKDFWEENKSELQDLLKKEQINGKVNELKKFSNRLYNEVSPICENSEAVENRFRSKCYITFEELPPLL